MPSHTTGTQELTKEELDMIASVADVGMDQINESSFLRRSGRLTKTQTAAPNQTSPRIEDLPEVANMPKSWRRIVTMKAKAITSVSRKTPAKVRRLIAAETAIHTGSTSQEAPTADGPEFLPKVATRKTEVAKPTGRKSLGKRQNPSNIVESMSEVTGQLETAASSQTTTHSNTDDVYMEASSAIDDPRDADFVPDVTPTDESASGMLSPHPLGGELPVSPPASPDGLSLSKKRKSDVFDSHDEQPKKRSTPKKASQMKVLPQKKQGPPAHGRPLVWAEGRQALCETLDYYHAYQSGGYTRLGVGYGFLLDKDVGERSYMDEEVVIARCGGGVAKNEDGYMAQAFDQKGDSARVATWSCNMRMKLPVVLIVGSNNDHCPVDIPHRYCVMDYFQVTNVWAEKTNGKTIFKVRFEKIHLGEKSWWAVQGSPPPPQERDFETKARQLHCGDCNEPSAQVFQQGWMCLNEQCAKFWTMDGVRPLMELAYSAAFLQERTQWPKQLKMPYSLKPEPLAPDTGDGAGYAVSRICWKGMACPRCGRCNSRVHWDAWRCQTGGCGFVHSVKQSVLSHRSVLGDDEIGYTGHAMLMDACLSSVTLREYELIGDWRVNTFDILPGNLVKHFCSNMVINKKPSGPDQLFRDLQATDMSLQRYAMSTSMMAGPALTRHFTANFGMPYKYVADQETTSLSEAPPCVINALHRLTWAGEQTVNDGSFQKFNEVLTLGYFEKQAIGYHDDGEKELGPTVATISLGCKAKMTLRMKRTYYYGISKAGVYDPRAPVLPGCFMEHERRALNAKAGLISDAAFEKERSKIYDGSKRSKNPPEFLTMHLHHGDMVVMHGAEMQKYYEHSIVPEEKLRFALTGRYIRPELIDPANHWKGDYTPNPAFIYNGDLPLASEDQSVALDGSNVSSTNASPADAHSADAPGMNASPTDVSPTTAEDAPAPDVGATSTYEAAPTPGRGASPVPED